MSSEGPYARGEHAGAPVAMLLAGPNGAGKSTSSRLLVPRQCVFLNVDVIAARLRKEGHQAEGLDIAAGRAVLAEMRRLVGVGGSFCVATNLAGRGLVQTVHSWQTRGYRVWLYFVVLRSPELAIARVAARVAGTMWLMRSCAAAGKPA